MGIGLAEQFADDAGHAVADAEHAGQQAWPAPAVGETPDRHEHERKQHTFEERLIELAGMARQRAAARKDHGPRHVGDAAPQLAVDEVGQPAEEQADRHHEGHQIRQHERVDLVAPGEGQDGDDDAQKPAMERHAAFPQGQDGERIGDVEAGLVEQHVAQPAAQDDAQGGPQQEVVDLDRREQLGRLFTDTPHDLPADDEARDVSQRIPADGEGPELDQHRVDLGIGDQESIHWARVIAGQS
jgi:hypothetical protein